MGIHSNVNDVVVLFEVLLFWNAQDEVATSATFSDSYFAMKL